MLKLFAPVLAALAVLLVTVAAIAQPILTQDDLEKLKGAFGERITVEEDPGNHKAFIMLDGEIIGVIEFEEGDSDDDDRKTGYPGGPGGQGVPQVLGPIDISGPAPFVDVFGTIFDDGSFTATGQGTVAGFPNVTVAMEGVISFGSTGMMTASYTMGAGGELPGGMPITYAINSRQLVQGDVNCDGVIDGNDVIQVALDVLGLSVNQVDPCPGFGENLADLWEDVLPAIWADPDCDLAISTGDMKTILEHMGGLPPAQEPGCTPVGSAFQPVP